MADVNLVPIIMQGRDESNFVPTDVEDGKFAYLVGMRKEVSQSDKVRKRFLWTIPYQCVSDDRASGCFSANSLRRLRVMTCMFGGYLINASYRATRLLSRTLATAECTGACERRSG
jgi:hypothetical protein